MELASSTYLESHLVYESRPVLEPIFECLGEGPIAYGPEACARMLIDVGDMPIGVDDGFSKSNFIAPGYRNDIIRWLRAYGVSPDDFKCLTRRNV